MRTPTTFAAFLCCLLFAAAPPPARAAKPAPPPADPAGIKDALAALAKGPIHELGDTLSQTNTRLDVLAAQMQEIGRNLDAAGLPRLIQRENETSSALAQTSDRTEAIEKRWDGIEQRLAQSSAAQDTALAAFRAEWEAEHRALAAVQAQSAQLATALPKDTARAVAGEIAAAASAQAAAQAQWARDLTRTGLVLAAAIAIWVGLAAWREGRARYALRSEIALALARWGAELRQALALTAPAPAAGPGAGTELAEIEERLRRLTERWELAAGVAAGRNGSRPINGSDAHETLLSPSEKPTVSIGLHAEPSIASRLLWPDDFLDPTSPLSRWRFLLESHFADGNHPALPVLAALLGLRSALGRPGTTSAQVATHAVQLSEALHAYWQSLADLSAEDRQQASAAWLASMRSLVATAAPRLELREVMPGARVDPDLMHAVKEGSGNHLSVSEVFSWAAIDRSGDRPRVLHRAQIAST